ncbi:helix-turn-helix domain-containing protein [Ohtaekwangia kribbensis]|uniref:Helix-turn-helix domain-containing protein n=1 Tax=Ohtaekwangia kribbensis TaxID=688913 RepID=A0ABW3JZD1_9BACT
MLQKQLTRDDLKQFRTELIRDLKNAMIEMHTLPKRKWMRSHEVRRMLGVCPATLQNLRDSGELPFSLLGRVMFYDADDSNNRLEQNKVNRHKQNGL